MGHMASKRCDLGTHDSPWIRRHGHKPNRGNKAAQTELFPMVYCTERTAVKLLVAAWSEVAPFFATSSSWRRNPIVSKATQHMIYTGNHLNNFQIVERKFCTIRTTAIHGMIVTSHIGEIKAYTLVPAYILLSWRE